MGMFDPLARDQLKRRQLVDDLDRALLDQDPERALTFVKTWGEALRHHLIESGWPNGQPMAPMKKD